MKHEIEMPPDKPAARPRVTCQVNNCVYNDHNNHCDAKEIRVGPGFAACATETTCATFKPQ